MNQSKPRELGCRKNMDVILELVSLQGATLVDVGCGDMGFTAQLAEHAERVVAIDPDPRQARINHSHPFSNVEFYEAGGQNLPLPDGSADGVFFAYSLHHIPATAFEAVFTEVQRVLRPHGFLYVIEPIDCPLNQVMKLFHDEDRERQLAQRALQEMAVPAFEQVDQVTYHSFSKYESFNQFAEHFGNRSFNTLFHEEGVRNDTVREAFQRLGGSDHRFASPKLVMCLKKLRSKSS